MTTTNVLDQSHDRARQTRVQIQHNVDLFNNRMAERQVASAIRERRIAEGIEQFTFQERETLRAMAEGSGVSFEDLAAFNIIDAVMNPDECSVFAAVGKAGWNGHSVFAKNSDKQGDPTLVGEHYWRNREINVGVDFVNDAGIRVVGVAAAGKLGLKIGLNSAGIVGGTNYSHTAEVQDRARRGVTSVDQQLAGDRALLLRRGLSHATALEAAKATLSDVIDSPMSTPGSIEFVDAAAGYVVEAAYREAALFSYTDEILIRTNKFEGLSSLNGVHDSSRARFERLKSQLEPLRGSVKPEHLEALSQDHENGYTALSICTHAPEFGSRTMGAMSVYFDADSGVPHFALALGSPCLAWPEDSGVFRASLTLDSPPIPEEFLTGEVWKQHFLDRDFT